MKQTVLLIAVIFCLLAQTVCAAEARAQKVEFNRDIRPILSENCFFCHGADAGKRKGKFRLDVAQAALAEGVIVPGKPGESKLVTRIFSKDSEEVMPPPDSKRHLTDAQKKLLRDWIKDGAKYENHWAFTAPKKASLPVVKSKKWPHNEIDNFVLARLEKEKLAPTPRASLERLLRRVSLDLTGLPPTPEQIKKWSSRTNAYEVAVDELLASPRFGERMASDWMDMARYADTHGFNNDSLRTMWRWRDWVIDAFNRNLPYDRFITEQLAGDLLEKPSLDQMVATGFNRNHVINSEGGIIDEEYRVEYVVDRVQTTSLAWLGLTVGCARCHDHKFDPVAQKDFYRLYAFFNSTDEFGEDGRIGNASPLMATPTTAQQTVASKQSALLQAASDKIKNLLATASAQNDFSGLSLESIPVHTNIAVALNLPTNSAVASALTNLAGGKPFEVTGAIASTNGPLGNPALTLNGQSFLKTEALPKIDTGKGWAIATWVKRDNASEAAIFSTMNFSAPPSSGSYGRGVEIRFTAEGAIEVRLSRRWPAYSATIVTRETVAQGEWRNLLVTSEGPANVKSLRVFLDGQECFRDLLHDNNAEVALDGQALIGSSKETNAHPFAGALADFKLLSSPIENEKLARESSLAALRFALETPAPARSSKQMDLLRAALLEKNNPEFSRAVSDAKTARAALLEIERTAPTTMVMHDLKTPRPTHILFRGQYDQPREIVEPGVPEFLLPFPASAPRNRLGLAQWLTDPRQPLTSRVVVNHFWQGLFGQGIVKSAEDFGFQADWPSHPELLDWLAVDFVASGWDVKKLIRRIVTSSTYCQDSNSSERLNERDPENRLLAHGPRQRLTAEMLRDQALAISGLLHEEIGGPPVFPFQPTNLYKGIVVQADYPGAAYTESQGKDLYRRSLYTFWKRTVPHPTLATFDAPDREVCVARRLRTNTPLQALALMNDPIQLEAARKFAERILIEGGEKNSDRLDFAFQLATARSPKSVERDAISSLLEQRLAHYKSNPDAAKALLAVGTYKAKESLDSAELAAYANIASLILNLDETITRN